MEYISDIVQYACQTPAMREMELLWEQAGQSLCEKVQPWAEAALTTVIVVAAAGVLLNYAIKTIREHYLSDLGNT